jgi:biopolymer transport protein ExbD
MSPAAWGGSAVPALRGQEGNEPRAGSDTTPFAGVALVLLIIFMGVMPALGGPYLPKARTASVVKEEMPRLGVDEQGKYWVGERPVPDAALADAVRAELASRPGQELVMLTGDRHADYHRVEGALNTLRSAGIRRVVLEAWLPRETAVVTIPAGLP